MFSILNILISRNKNGTYLMQSRRREEKRRVSVGKACSFQFENNWTG